MNLTEKILLLKYTHQKLNVFEYLEILSNNFKNLFFTAITLFYKSATAYFNIFY